MKKAILPILFIFLAGCGDDNSINIVQASAALYDVSSEDQITFIKEDEIGMATLSYNYNFTTLEVDVSGLPPSTSHAMHLHMGSLEVPGHHWNQGGADSFCNELSLDVEWNKPFAGDIGNLEIDENGDGYFKLSTDLWRLGTEDAFDINGTVIFIHENSEFFSANCSAARVDNILHTNPKIAGGTVDLKESK